MRYIVFHHNGAFLAGFLADFAAYTTGAAIVLDLFALIFRVAQNTNLALVRHYFNKFFRADSDTFSAGCTFFRDNHGSAFDNFYRFKLAGVLTASVPNTTVMA